jgi:predicted PurR-regulated permease PerM
MEEKRSPSGWVAVSFATLIGLAAALFAVALRRAQRIAKGEQPQSPATHFEELSAAALPPEERPVAAVRTSGSTRWTTPTKYIMSVVLFLAALGVLFIGRGVISMVLIAAILALFVNPLIDRLHTRLHMKWGAAVSLTYVLVILILLLIPLLVIPNLISALNYLLNLDYPAILSQVAAVIGRTANSAAATQPLGALLAPLLDSLAAALQNFSIEELAGPANVTVTLSGLTSQLVGRLGALVNILSPVVTLAVTAIFTLLMAFQMSLASPNISGWYPDLVPPAYKEEYSGLLEKITGTWINFLRGQLTLMLIIGVVIWIGGSLLGVPFALLMGVIAGLLELIPSVGPTLAAIPAVLLALVLGSTYLPIENNLVFALIVVAFYVLVQLIENQFVVPHVMGEAVDLPPLIVLIGALAGATAFGILGALLATPVIATGNLVFQYIYRKILEPPPLPPEPESTPGVWERVRGWAGRIPIPGRKKPAVSPLTGKSEVPSMSANPEA